MIFLYALSTAGMSTTTTGQESSTCWSSTIRRKRITWFRQDRNFNAVLLQIICYGHKSDWFAKFFYCQCRGENIDKSLVPCLDSLRIVLHSRNISAQSHGCLPPVMWSLHRPTCYRSC